MVLRRGFKKETNEYAKEFREELNKKPHEALCPWELAELLSIPVHKLSLLDADVDAIDYLTSVNQDVFSAVSVFRGHSRIIIHNDSHHPYRQAANISHELSHAILGHRSMPPFTHSGERFIDPDVQECENEANWMGPSLLISEEAALYIVRNKINLNSAARLYGVSKQLIQMRINVTGARKRVSRYK